MGKLKDNLNYKVYLIAYVVGLVLSLIPVLNILGMIDIFVVTLYLYYMLCEALHNLNMACGLKEGGDTSKKSVNYALYVIFDSLTLGIYGIWWMYVQRERMNLAAQRYGAGVFTQFKDQDKKSFYFILGAKICGLVKGILAISIFFGSIIGAANSLVNALSWGGYGNNYGSSGFGSLLAGAGFAIFFFFVLQIASVVLRVVGWYCFYHDVNILSAVFNRETHDGNQIICVQRQGGPAPQRPVERPAGIPGQEMNPMPPAGMPKFPRKAGVKALSGQYAGSIIEMKENDRIVIGRDASKCDLICSSDKISRVHLSITYRPSPADGNHYIVRDMSSNGTRSSSTGTLPKDFDVRQPSGAILTLGNSGESIQLL